MLTHPSVVVVRLTVGNGNEKGRERESLEWHRMSDAPAYFGQESTQVLLAESEFGENTVQKKVCVH